MTSWLIQQQTELASPTSPAEFLYWNNDQGWTDDISNATQFTQNERNTFGLPSGDFISWIKQTKAREPNKPAGVKAMSMLKHYTVLYWIPTEVGKPTHTFFCQADDSNHAREQCKDAEPKARIINTILDED